MLKMAHDEMARGCLFISGSRTEQSFRAASHRGWKLHPWGGLRGLGTSLSGRCVPASLQRGGSGWGRRRGVRAYGWSVKGFGSGRLFQVQFLPNFVRQPVSDQGLVGHRLHRSQLSDGTNLERVHFYGDILKLSFPLLLLDIPKEPFVQAEFHRNLGIYSGEISLSS